jgi:hypothetical protein
MMRKNLKPQLVLFFLLVSSLLGIIALVFNGDRVLGSTAELKGVNFAESYILGEKVDIPVGTITVGDKTVQSTAIIRFPDGSKQQTNSFTPLNTGLYSVEYRAVIDGKMYKEVCSFCVYPPFASVSTRSDYAEYGEHEYMPGKPGLKVGLNSGSRLTLNQVIDLRTLTKEDELINFFITPETIGVMECRILYITLTDIYDKNNFITVKFNHTPDNSSNVVYISAKASTQTTYYGVEKGIEGVAPTTGNYGFAATGSFKGVNVGKTSSRLSFSYDLQNNSVHCKTNTYGSANSGDYIIDFAHSSFGTSWKGFATGEVYMSMEASGYAKPSMSLIITHLAGMDMSRKSAEIHSVPGGVIDFGEYSSDDYPVAVIGMPYKLFSMETDKRFGLEKTLINVYTNYKTSTQAMLSITDGKFIPVRPGEYTAEYKTVDRYGNEGIQTVKINAVQSTAPVSVEVGIPPVTLGNVGEITPVAEVVSIAGGSGKIAVSVRAINLATGTVIPLGEERVFRPRETGVFKIEYTAVDYVGQIDTDSYDITIITGDHPVFEESPELPPYMLAGQKYTLPELKAYQYNTGSRIEISTKIRVNDAAGERILTDNIFSPTVDNSGDEIEIVYLAESVLDSQKIAYSEIYKIKTLNPGNDGQLDLSKYFATSGFVVASNSSNISFTDNGEGGNALFVRPLVYNGLSVIFQIKADKNAATAIKFYLIDKKDDAKRVEIRLINQVTKSAVSVNGSDSKSFKTSFGGDSKDFKLEIVNNRVVFGSAVIQIVSFSNGFPFEGFSDGVCYLSWEYEDVGAAGMCIEIKNINGQPFSASVKSDIIAPMLQFYGAVGGSYTINDKVILSAASAIDVLNVSAKVTVSMVRPGGGYIVSNDGVVLNKADCSRSYEVTLDVYGTYLVTYSYIDGADNTDDYRYGLMCVDIQRPEITLSKTSDIVKIGKSVTLPTIAYSDNNTDYSASPVEIFLLSADYSMSVFDKTQTVFTSDKPGKYVFKYLLTDANGNVRIVEYTVTVVD